MSARPQRIGILGAGALGTLFGWHLARDADVTFLDVRADLCEAIARDGIRLEGESARPAKATTDAAPLYASDAMFVFVKATDTLRALRPFAGQLNPSTVIVSLQNGIGNEEAIKTACGGHVALAMGATTEAALALADGVSQRVGVGTTVLGSGGATSDAVERIAADLSASGLPTRCVYDIRPHLWGKLIATAAINAVSALLDRDAGVILEDPDAAAVARAIAAEGAEVAQAQRIKLLFSDPWTYVRQIAEQTAGARTSMAIDLLAGRTTEIDATNGAIAALGRRIGVATPVNETMARLIRARQRV